MTHRVRSSRGACHAGARARVRLHLHTLPAGAPRLVEEKRRLLETAAPRMSLQDFIDGVDQDAFWSYKGSLTTPPCTEGVYWTVFEEVQPISDEQLEGFTRHFADNYDFANGKGNNREIMPLNDRTLYFSADAAATLATGAVALAMAALSIF